MQHDEAKAPAHRRSVEMPSPHAAFSRPEKLDTELFRAAGETEVYRGAAAPGTPAAVPSLPHPRGGPEHSGAAPNLAHDQQETDRALSLSLSVSASLSPSLASS